MDHARLLRRFWPVLVLVSVSCGGPDPGPKTPRETLDPLREVELLSLCDPQRDSRTGAWKVLARMLVAPAERHARLDVPYEPPEEYDFKLAIERLQHRTGHFGIGLPCGTARVSLVLESGDERSSGLEFIDRVPFDGNETTARRQIFFSGIPASVVCQVRRDRLRVIVDDKTLIDWKAEYARVSPNREWGDVSESRLFIGSHLAAFRVSRMSVVPVSAPGKLLR